MLGVCGVVVEDAELGRALRPARDPSANELLFTPREAAERRVAELEAEPGRRG